MEPAGTEIIALKVICKPLLGNRGGNTNLGRASKAKAINDSAWFQRWKIRSNTSAGELWELISAESTKQTALDAAVWQPAASRLLLDPDAPQRG